MSTFKTMSIEELKSIHAAIEEELKTRKTARRDELIKSVCDAMNALAKEFPSVELNISYECSDCQLSDEVDVMYYLCSGREVSPRDFTTY